MASSVFTGLDPYLPFPTSEPVIPYEQWKNQALNHLMRKEFSISRLPLTKVPDPDADEPSAEVQQAHCYSDAEKNLDIYLSLGVEGQ